MVGAIFYLFIYSDIENDPKALLTKGTISSYWYRSIFWLFVLNFFLLGWIGAMPAQETYVKTGVFLTRTHFILLVAYVFWFPKTIFDYLNNFRIFILKEINSSIKKNISFFVVIANQFSDNFWLRILKTPVYCGLLCWIPLIYIQFFSNDVDIEFIRKYILCVY